MANKIFLGLGTNLGDREDNLEKAVELICKSVGRISAVSSVYESEPWGFQCENKFLNMVIKAETGIKPEELLEIVMQAEAVMGRIRTGDHYSSRIIDIDILLYNSRIINKTNLIIPHPLIHERKFVLMPLCEIAPEAVHPVFEKKFTVLLKECRDERRVVMIHPFFKKR